MSQAKLTQSRANALREKGYSEEEVVRSFYEAFVQPTEDAPDFDSFFTVARQKLGWEAPPLIAPLQTTGPTTTRTAFTPPAQTLIPPEGPTLGAAQPLPSSGVETAATVGLSALNVPLTVGTGIGTGLGALAQGKGLSGAFSEAGKIMGFQGLEHVETPVSQVMEAIVGSPRLRGAEYVDTAARRWTRGLLTFAGEVALPLSLPDTWRRLGSAAKAMKAQGARIAPELEEMLAGQSDEAVNLLKPMPPTPKRQLALSPEMESALKRQSEGTLLPEQMTATRKAFEESTGNFTPADAPEPGKLVDAIRKRVQKRTRLTLEEELQGQSFLKEELTPTFRPPSRDVLIPSSRRIVPIDRQLRGTGLLEIADLSKRRELTALEDAKAFLQPTVEYLKKNPTARARITEALDTGTLGGEKLKQGQTVADLLKGEERQAFQTTRATFNELAARLGLPREQFIKDYLTHVFEKEYHILPEELSRNSAVRNLHFKFFEARTGGKPPELDVLESLEAYLPLALRHIHTQPAVTLMNLKLSRFADQPHRHALGQFFINNFAGMPDPFVHGFEKGILHKIGEGTSRAVDQALAIISQKKEGLHIKWSPAKSGVKYDILDRAGNVVLRTDTAEEAAEALRSFTRFQPKKLERVAMGLTSNFYRATIGANLASSIRNLHQVLLTGVRSGVYPTLKGLGFLADRGMRETVKTIMGPGHVGRELVESQYTGVMKKLDDVVFAMFNGAEMMNRGTAFWAGVNAARSVGQKNLDTLIRAGTDSMIDTQFLYGVMGRSPAFSHPVTRPLGAFTSFPLKAASWTSTVLREGLESGFQAARSGAPLGKKLASLPPQQQAEFQAMARLIGIAGLGAVSGTEHGRNISAQLMGAGFNGWEELRGRLKKGVSPMGGLLKSSIEWAMAENQGGKDLAARKFLATARLLTGIPITGIEGLQKIWAVTTSSDNEFEVIDPAGVKLFTLSRGAAFDWAFGLSNKEVGDAFEKLKTTRAKKGTPKPTEMETLLKSRFEFAPVGTGRAR